VEIDGKEVKGPEYEILCLLGANMLINDMEAILRWNHEMDLLGLDAIGACTLIGFAAELNEKGLWKNGIEFGKKDNLSRVLEDMAYRRGEIGDDLAKGTRYLSEKYGGKEFAPQVKGLELAAYEPRGAVGHGLGFATANRGGCHLDGGYVVFFEVAGPSRIDQYHTRSKAGWVILFQNMMSAISSCGQCLFTGLGAVPGPAFALYEKPRLASIVEKVLNVVWPIIELADMLPMGLLRVHVPLLPHSKAIALATGMKFYFGDFLAMGARGFTLERMFNLREGMTGAEDTLPKRFLEVEQIPGRPETKVPLEKMLPHYYRIRGWDDNGVPTRKTLKSLGLEFTYGALPSPLTDERKETRHAVYDH
ncbi:MAG TPA: aldehyde ferredoxin oxidoreductase C-terminal domain-containing protein, partial [Deltaproteobacteria bacterium]|nr:aldehyde ferredoxin oxidoreductase C-terminal domain-containing protein [Deltaproteobacteria bacterium]